MARALDANEGLIREMVHKRASWVLKIAGLDTKLADAIVEGLRKLTAEMEGEDELFASKLKLIGKPSAESLNDFIGELRTDEPPHIVSLYKITELNQRIPLSCNEQGKNTMARWTQARLAATVTVGGCDARCHQNFFITESLANTSSRTS